MKKKLQQEIHYLEKSLNNLEILQTKFTKVNSIQTELNRELNQILHDLKKEASISIEDYFREEQNIRKKSNVEIKKSGLFPKIPPSSSLSFPQTSYEPFSLASWLRKMVIAQPSSQSE